MSKSRLPRLVEEPEWLRRVQPDSMLNARDVADIFGFSIKSLWELIEDHGFPEADTFNKGKFTSRKTRQWKVSTIRAEILRRKQLHSN